MMIKTAGVSVIHQSTKAAEQRHVRAFLLRFNEGKVRFDVDMQLLLLL